MLDKVAFSVSHQIRNSRLLKADVPDDLSAQIDLSGLNEIDIDQEYSDVFKSSASIVSSDYTGAVTGAFNQIFQDANDFAKARSAEMISQITDATRNDLRQIISGGLDSKLTKDDIADLISQQTAFSDTRAQLIAETEIRIANNQGALAQMKNLAGKGVQIQKAWHADSDPCPTCQANEDEGPIDVDDEFYSGDDAAPAHPNCLCSIYSVFNEGE